MRNIKKIKTDELGINVSNSWTCRTKNIRKNQKWYAQQSQITLFTLPWDTLYLDNRILFLKQYNIIDDAFYLFRLNARSCTKLSVPHVANSNLLLLEVIGWNLSFLIVLWWPCSILMGFLDQIPWLKSKSAKNNCPSSRPIDKCRNYSAVPLFSSR